MTAISSTMQLSARECAESWSVIYGQTLAVRKRWPSIWTLPLVPSAAKLLAQHLPENGSVLEIGAANTSTVRATLERERPSVRYFSFDIDRRTKQDFYAWDEVNRAFDAAVCFEVVEHVSPAIGLDLCAQAWSRLNPGGVFIVGTPNIFNPTRYLQDPTHVTPWAYDRLGGALLALGFEVIGMARLQHQSAPGRWRTRLLAWIALKLQPHLRMDFADSIYVVGRRPLSS